MATLAYQISYQNGEHTCTAYVESKKLIDGLLAHWNEIASLGKGMRSMGYNYFQTPFQAGCNLRAELVRVPSLNYVHTTTRGGFLVE